MRGEREPVTGVPDEADDALDGVRVEPIAPDEQKESSAHQSVSALSWTKRLSTRGKLARALIAMLAVISRGARRPSPHEFHAARYHAAADSSADADSDAGTPQRLTVGADSHTSCA